MPIDTSNLPVSGGLILSSLVYAGLSLFVTGPMVGERTIEMSGWSQRCALMVSEDLPARQPQPAFAPELGCETLFGWAGEDGHAFCRRYGGRFQMPFLEELQRHQQRLADFNRKRLRAAVSKTSSRCTCAASLVLEDKKSAFALYAGSLRLISPPAVNNLESELTRALHAASCALKE